MEGRSEREREISDLLRFCPTRLGAAPPPRHLPVGLAVHTPPAALPQSAVLVLLTAHTHTHLSYYPFEDL